MSFSIHFTAVAQRDMHDIFEYIAYELQSVSNAVGQLERIEHGIMSLAQMPERYRVYEKEPWRSRNLRIMPIDNYLVFYISDCAENQITIVRVIYGGRDVYSQLNNN